MKSFSGKKTYIVTAVMFLYGLVGLVMGWIPSDQATGLMLQAASMAALRNGIKK